MLAVDRMQTIFCGGLRFTDERRVGEILMIRLAAQSRAANKKTHYESFARIRSIATIERVRASTPSSKSLGVVNSLPTWLSPPTLGTKIIAAGATDATHIAS